MRILILGHRGMLDSELFKMIKIKTYRFTAADQDGLERVYSLEIVVTGE